MYIGVKVSPFINRVLFLLGFMKLYSNNTSNNLGEQNNVDYCSEVDRQTLHSEMHSAEKKCTLNLFRLPIYFFLFLKDNGILLP